MTDVDTLFREYVAKRREAGRLDPGSFLSKVEGVDRAELEVLIDGFLARERGPQWDPDEFADSPAARVTEAISSRWGEWEVTSESVPWSELLPALRDRVAIKRAELVQRLAVAIGASGQEEKVSAYYHQMETDALPSEGVSDRVLAALSELLRTSVEKLRAAGSVIGAGGGQDEVFAKVAFARTAIRDPRYASERPEALTDDLVRQSADELDDVDRLFTGGADAGG